MIWLFLAALELSNQESRMHVIEAMECKCTTL